MDRGDCAVSNEMINETGIPRTPAPIPFLVENFLDFIDISNDGYMLLGSSNLNSRYWNGSVWYFINADSAPDKDKSLTGVDCETGVTDGKFLDSQEKVIIGEDSGELNVLALTEVEDDHSFHFILDTKRNAHDSAVLTISVSPDKTKVVTGSMDMSVKLWATDVMLNEGSYSPAHSHHVTSVCYCPSTGSSIFSSCSLDGSLLIWDARQSKPASEMLQDKHGLTALSWKYSSEDVLAVGSVVGTVSLFDVRMTKPLAHETCLDRPIHRLAFDQQQRFLAVCGDTHVVKVLDTCSPSLNTIYSDTRHNDFVRGLAWHPKTQKLFSCGWDKQVLSHHFILAK